MLEKCFILHLKRKKYHKNYRDEKKEFFNCISPLHRILGAMRQRLFV